MEVIRSTDVIKVGTNTAILNSERVDREPNLPVFKSVGEELAARDSVDGKVLVTSAGIMMGMLATSTLERPDENQNMAELQRQSSIGWRYLLNTWAEHLGGKEVGSLQLTRQELSEHQPRSEALHVIEALILHGDQAVINENDAVVHDEITFGDNDILAATLAVAMAQSNRFGTVRLFLLSDTDGVYENVDDPESRIAVIENTDDHRHLIVPSQKVQSSGGMESKFAAADIANASGVDMWLYNPANGQSRFQAIAGEIGTHFVANRSA